MYLGSRSLQVDCSKKTKQKNYIKLKPHTPQYKIFMAYEARSYKLTHIKRNPIYV